MAVLTSGLRSELERAVGAGRGLAERAAAGVLTRLGVVESSAPAYLSEPERELRRGLRARARQLGDSVSGDVASGVPLLIAEVSYEQWHRILFARFLEANGLLMHPEFGASVTLEECGEFAAGLGEPDAWSVAARFASEILPGIFRPDDPAVRVRLAPEDLLALERVVTALPEETFLAEDSLGWVYQFWQSKQKKVVNDSGRKIGGADISPVTQLFTEDYMVRFLLENSLGAWWAGKHPESPLLAGYDFLRFGDDGMPAAGTFEGWPDRLAEVTVMDPCCGSGHFLVAAFGMLWRMRAEEESLSPATSQDAVLRDNLFGLELDARCTKLAMFALALEAWKQGGYRALPVPNVACSGIPAKAAMSAWTKLAKGDYKLEATLRRLHELFKDADTLGSLIDPVHAAEQAGLESVDWDTISPLLITALEGEAYNEGDPAAEVFGHAAAGIARAAQLLSDKYTLIATNPPYLGAGRQSAVLHDFIEVNHFTAKPDLATAFIDRFLGGQGTSFAVVAPQNWLFQPTYQSFRRRILILGAPKLIAQLGEKAFASPFAAGAFVALYVVNCGARPGNKISSLDVADEASPIKKSRALREDSLFVSESSEHLARSDSSIVLSHLAHASPLSMYVRGTEGLSTGDGDRYVQFFWSVPYANDFEPLQGSPAGQLEFDGLSEVIRWEAGKGTLARSRAARVQGQAGWGKSGVLLGRVRTMRASIHLGWKFDKSCVVLLPLSSADTVAIYCFVRSAEFDAAVRTLDKSLKVTVTTLLKVPFDADRWRATAVVEYPDGLPEPFSNDPTQWLFRGAPLGSTEPLQVAVSRLIGFEWPGQVPDNVDALVDNDGIVCLPAVSGEQGAAERVRAVLAASFGTEWSNTRMDELLIAAGGKPGDLEGWLRDVFFTHHTKVFQNRPFVWHVWDGRSDGFSALVNYHRLNRQTLERLTYTTLGWWIDRQRADAGADVAGAAARLAAAEALREKLALILEGEPPYDIHVRWKSLAEQPLGWDPDMLDGVRMNIRPFVEAKILRSPFTINWNKDRGANPDGSERHNDLHFTREQKEEAR